MNRGFKSRSGKVLFEEGPNPENQPPHSPATSSNTLPLPCPNAQLSKEILAIYLPKFVKGEDVPETRVTTRPNPNNGGYQFTTPPRANRSRRHSGPHLSPTAQIPTESLNISGDSISDMESTAHYPGARTPESHADSFGGVGQDSSAEVGLDSSIGVVPFSASPLANYNFTEEWLHRKSLKTLEPKKEKFPKNESF
ncbi:hypothetical protein M0R45_035563 [Rubus argutus]|uniref:Uncharacterized protein n=1 Tax=Rubus argutus TaxID=59490 RepID=A0AAW1VXB2_RUBAR